MEVKYESNDNTIKFTDSCQYDNYSHLRNNTCINEVVDKEDICELVDENYNISDNYDKILQTKYKENFKVTEKKAKNTIIVNIFGGPGVGKSTAAAYIFSQLKMKGYDVEYVSEFAKDKVWENNIKVFNNQLYIAGKQSFKISRCFGEVDIIITDSPILIGAAYTDRPALKMAINEEFDIYKQNNLNFLIPRTTKYDPNGRNQTEDEAIRIDNKIKSVLDYNGQMYAYDLLFKMETRYDTILNIIIQRLGILKSEQIKSDILKNEHIKF